MIDYKKVFIDTAPFIYFIEKDENNPQYFNKVKGFLMDCHDRGVRMETSVITLEEYMVFPYRINAQEYIDIFEKLIRLLDIHVSNVDAQIAKKAAKIRAEYRAFKGMDALQLAAACENGCEVFLTNDRQLKQFKEIKCMIIDELD